VSIRHRLANLGRIAIDRDGARHEAVRVWTFKLARRVTPLVGVEGDGVRFVVSTRETGVGFFTFVHGAVFDEENVRRLAELLPTHTRIASLRGTTVLEVGANIGTETVSMLVRHGVKHVVAVEPDPENVRLLRANLALNGVEDRVDVHPIALSDTDGTVAFERSPDNWGDHRVRVADASAPGLFREEGRTVVDVPARTLDSLVDDNEIELAGIDLVWMDVQGHEAHVLGGARKLAAAGIPVLTEYWPYGLARAGALDRFHAMVAENYGTVVDLRAGALPAADVATLADHYQHEPSAGGFTAHTDLLLVPRS
jgi:FkbM family methyltransferase